MENKDYARIIAKNLKRLAYEHNRTQAQMSRDLGINKQTLSSWMSGYRIPRMAKIDLLCHYFNCSRNDIMEPYVPKELPSFTEKEVALIKAYREAPESRRESVRALLGIEGSD